VFVPHCTKLLHAEARTTGAPLCSAHNFVPLDADWPEEIETAGGHDYVQAQLPHVTAMVHVASAMLACSNIISCRTGCALAWHSSVAVGFRLCAIFCSR
jgi:hypothetical protein